MRTRREERISARETALRLGIRLDNVYKLLWAGKLPATKVEGQWQVAAKEVEARLSRRATV